jgi:hypothetical protein
LERYRGWNLIQQIDMFAWLKVEKSSSALDIQLDHLG